jgi:hypothetical protein
MLKKKIDIVSKQHQLEECSKVKEILSRRRSNTIRKIRTTSGIINKV